MRRHVAFIGTFHPQAPLPRRYFWDSLPLYAAIEGTTWFEYLQDAPDFGWPASEDGTFRVDKEYYRNPRHAILFSDFGEEIFFERGAANSRFPRNLPPVPEIRTYSDPSSRAVTLIRLQTTTRISPRDEPSSTATHQLAPIGLRYPDPMALLDKINRYCLARDHADRKWMGFEAAGYSSLRGDDAHLLAASLCSSLMYDPVLRDLRATADGALQFGVDVALPKRRGGLMPVATSWTLRSSSAPMLGTAYVSGSSSSLSLAATMTIPNDLDGFGLISDWVKEESASFAEGHYADGAAAFGWLWVRHDHPRSGDFARWLRRSSLSAGTFTRRRLGGKVTQWPLSGADGASTEARLSFAQSALLLSGIRTHRELVWD